MEAVGEKLGQGPSLSWPQDGLAQQPGGGPETLGFPTCVLFLLRFKQ